MDKQLNIGWAQTDITPDRPVYVIGQLYARISQYVHDPLTATCLVLENDADQITLVSADISGAPVVHIPAILDRLSIKGLDKSRVCFNATHTHNSTLFSANTTRVTYFEKRLGEELCPVYEEPTDILKDDELAEFFIDKMVALITSAWAARAPGGISLAQDYAAVAHNRRPQFFRQDGTRESRMYGACSAENFAGFEGTSDHSADMLYTWNQNNDLTGVAVCIPCPSQVYELHDFLSADYWGNARSHIRESLGNVFVLPMCGPAGDQNPLDLIRLSKTNEETLRIWNAQERAVFRNFDMFEECDGIGQRVAEAVTRGYRRARNNIQTSPAFRSERFEMSVPLRRVSDTDYLEAKKRVDEEKAKHSPENRFTEAETIRLFEPLGVINRWERQQSASTLSFPVFVFRIGKAAFATNPFELYCEYGFRIKACCKATQTILIQLSSNANLNYLPTQAAVDGGSYGSKPVSTQAGPEGGNALVKKTIEAINKLFEA